MSDTDRQELISQFVDVTGASADRAQFYLESANWTLQLALTSFFEQDDNPGPEAPEDEEDELPAFTSAVAASVPPLTKASKEKKSKTRNASGARIMTLGNMASSSDDDDENTGQAFYAGGSDRSGQQVLGPPRKNPASDYVSDIFRSARESGAEVVENPHAPSASSVRSFFGSGYRLGQTDDDHVLLPDATRNRSQNAEPVILRLWRQGFTINDGELRLYEDKKNKEFLDCVTKGQLPPELRQTDGNMVQVNLEDHRHEDHKPMAQKVQAFAGKGHTLGSPAPNVTESSATSFVPSSTSSTNNEENEKLANEQLNVDTSAPVTNIQIRLADGSRLSGRFNHSHTIDDIRRYITTARPQYAAQSFVLLTTFPSKELNDTSETIEASKLLNSAIMQRLK